MRKKTQEEYIAEVQAKYGFDKFDCARTIYGGALDKVEIRCLRCGDYFWRRADRHLAGSGCPVCDKKARLTPEGFVKKALEKHGEDRFSYDRASYKGWEEKVEIGCLQCGDYFWQRAGDHLGGHGCRKCGNKRDPLISTEDYIKKAHAKYGLDKFGYDRVQFAGALKEVQIKCFECGEYFWQVAREHLRGKGCPNCRRGGRLSAEEFLARADQVYGTDEYVYDLTKYDGFGKKISILHVVCGLVFNQTPSEFLRGTGCPSCSPSGFNPGKPAILYYVRFDRFNEDPLYKIGITNRTVQERFANEPLPYTILQETPYLFGFLARDREQEILSRHESDRYRGDALVSGNTEAFVWDVLGLERVIGLSA